MKVDFSFKMAERVVFVCLRSDVVPAFAACGRTSNVRRTIESPSSSNAESIARFVALVLRDTIERTDVTGSQGLTDDLGRIWHCVSSSWDAFCTP